MTDFVFIPPETTKKAVTKSFPLPNCWRPRRTPKDKIRQINEHIAAVVAEQGAAAGIAAKREICRRDIFYLGYDVLGYTDSIEPLHDDLCDFMVAAEKSRKDSLVLIPRAHFKSTWCTVVRCIWWMIRDPDVAIGLFSGNMKNARKFAVEIRSHLDNNNKLKGLFPDIFFENPRKESPLWTVDEFVIKRSQKGVSRKEGTLKIFGLLQNIPTGDHYSPGRLIGDDIVDQEICQSEDQMSKVEDQLQYLIPLQQVPTDPIHYVGTRYHINDAYGKMLDDPRYTVYLRQDVEEGEPILAPRFTQEMLEKTRIRIGNYKYQCQYKLDPQDPSDKKFKLEWLQTFRRGSITADDPYYSRFLMVDPAHKQKKESDFTAMLVLALDYQLNVYLLDGLHDKLNPKERVDNVFRLAKDWNLDRIGYETIAFQDTDKFWVEQEMLNRNHYFEILEISHRKQNKFDYILGSQPIYQSKRFFLPSEPMMYTRVWENPDDGYARTVDLKELFMKQYELFPNVVHDDLLDDVSMGIRLMDRGLIPRAKKPSNFSAAYPKIKREDDYNLLAH